MTDTADYDKLWKEVEKLEREGLYQSCLEKVNEIYKLATEEEVEGHQLKAMIYRVKLNGFLEDRESGDLLKLFENDVESLTSPNVKAVGNSLLGQAYIMYGQAQAGRMQNRTEVEGNPSEDINTWSSAQIANHASNLYLKSIEPGQNLKQTNVNDFEAIYTLGNESVLTAENLYEWLHFRAIAQFGSSNTLTVKSVGDFKINDPQMIADADTFRAIDVKNEDNNTAKTLRLFQELLDYYSDSDRIKYAAINIKRLNFINQNATFENKNDLFLATLEEEFRKEKNEVGQFIIGKTLIKEYINKGHQYSNNFNPENKGYFEKADQILKQISSVSNYKNDIKNLENSIRNPELSLGIEQSNLPNQSLAMRVAYRNIEKAFSKVVRLDANTFERLNRIYETSEVLNILKRQETVTNKDYILPNGLDKDHHACILDVNPLKKGIYAILVSNNTDFRDGGQNISLAATFIVTELSYTARSYNGKTEIVVVNRLTGQPIAEANVKVEEIKYDHKTRKNKRVQLEEGKTDGDGVYAYEGENRNFSFSISHNEDELMSNDNFRNYKNRDQKEHLQVHTFTDRSIYRPGQQVYFKALAVLNKPNGIPTVAANQKIEVVLRDANWQEIKKQSYTTNAYGSINDVYQLPKNLLNGSFTLVLNYGNGAQEKRFRVEEYKRPRFKVELDSIQSAFKLGDQIKMSGVATQYSGAFIANAKVKYRVVKSSFYYYYCSFYRPFYHNNNTSEIIAVGETTSDQKGQFSLAFPSYKNSNEYYNSQYTLEVDVTDERGETITSSKSIRVSNKALRISSDLSDQVFSSDLQTANLKIQNLDGKEVAASGNAVLTKLNGPNTKLNQAYWGATDINYLEEEKFKNLFPNLAYSDELNPEKWSKIETVKELTIDQKSTALDLSGLDGGYYKLKVEVKDEKGNEGSYLKYFYVGNIEKQQIPALNDFWLHATQKTVEPGETFEFQILTPRSDQKVYYTIYQKNADPKSRWLTLNDDKDQKIQILDSDRGGMSIDFWYIKNNRWHSYEHQINVPWSNKELNVSYTNWRDKVVPGSEDQIKIKLSGNKKSQIAAEVLAGMYDASLDQFSSQSWTAQFYQNFRKSSYWRSSNFGLARIYKNHSYRSRDKTKYNDRYAPQVNWFQLYFGPNYVHYEMEESINMRSQMAGARPMAKKMKARDMADTDQVAVAEASGFDSNSMSNDSMNDAPAMPPGEEAGASKDFEFAPRENLNETVFFFPEMNTDKEGNLEFTFKHNEALTEWKFLLFAHTKELEFVFDEKKLKTQKDLMILPNVPRFLRQGDQLFLTASINSMSDKMLEAESRIEIRNAITDIDVTSDFVSQASHQTTLKSKAQLKQEWRIEVPDDFIDPVKIIYKTRAGNFTDGEVHVLPVLTNRKLVTETMAFHVEGSSTNSFSFDRLNLMNESKTLINHNLSIEFTSNPVWFAIKSIPYLKSEHHENAVDIAQRIYANLLARKILDDNPQIEKIFKTWENDPGALKSNLSKNQELKTALLEQTPWVLDAQSEEEQMRNISLLFNRNNIENSLQNDLKKLSGFQLSNGGFSWFQGGRDSWYITQSILTSFGHLDKLGVDINNSGMQGVIQNALNYTDQRIVEYYHKVKKHLSVNSSIVQYLYMRSFYDLSIPSETRKVIKECYQWLDKKWVDHNTNLQAMVALAAHRDGKNELVDRIVKSLDERAIKNEELGTYWKNHGFAYYWYDNKIERQASLIELYHELGKPEREIDDMKIWLLKNKQTNRWENTKTTSFAIYALLLDRNEWLDQLKAVQLKVAGQKIQADKIEAGTGYFKSVIDGSELSPSHGQIEVVNSNKTIAWGAAYYQYFEDLDQIKSDEGTAVDIKKEIFKRVDTAEKRTLVKLDQNVILQPGDFLTVRIEIRADREMEFVHLKDMRGSGIEPVNVLSQYHYQDGLSYYESTKDLSSNFYFDYLPKGTFVFEYPVKVVHKGSFSNGVTEIQSMYAPEFGNHSSGMNLEVPHE